MKMGFNIDWFHSVSHSNIIPHASILSWFMIAINPSELYSVKPPTKHDIGPRLPRLAVASTLDLFLSQMFAFFAKLVGQLYPS
jgi:hypothetical protein